MPKKNDIVKIKITDMTLEGMGVGRTDDGYILFVPMSAVGDILNVKILKALSSYGYGKIEEILSASPSRTESDCAVFSKCGGCVFRHIKYEDELKIKKNLVDEQFARIGGFDIRCEDIIPSPAVNGYRNKAQFPVGKDENGVFFGFFASHSHRIIKCENCRLHPDFYEDILLSIKDWADRFSVSVYNEETGSGLLRHVYIRDGRKSGEIMVCIVSAGKIPKSDKLVECLKQTGLNIVSVVLCVNNKKGNEILSDKFINLYGKDFMTDELCGLEFDISPRSFYQVNHDGAEKLYSVAKEYAELRGDELLVLRHGNDRSFHGERREKAYRHRNSPGRCKKCGEERRARGNSQCGIYLFRRRKSCGETCKRESFSRRYSCGSAEKGTFRRCYRCDIRNGAVALGYDILQ